MIFTKSTKSLIGRLITSFALLSFAIGALIIYSIFSALQWSEDRMGERRIHIDSQTALQLYTQEHRQGHIKLDSLTDAYNDLQLVPEPFRTLLAKRQTFVGETGPEGHSRMVYLSYYFDHGQSYPLVLLSKIDQVEFSSKEITMTILYVMMSVFGLFLVFGYIIYRLSQRLIEPLEHITQQIEATKGETDYCYQLPPGSVIEFQSLIDKLNNNQLELSRLLKSEQDFARYASHELRTPLSVIRGSQSLLLNTNVNEAFRTKQIKRIGSAANDMQTMIDALLSLVRYEKESDPQKRSFNATELQEIINNNQAQADDKSITIKVFVEGEPMIAAEPAMMAILIGNILRNAIAASPKSSEITVSLQDRALIVIDQGGGLGHSPSPQGHGLGLDIISTLCQRFEWQFELLNNPNGGCRAKIHF